MARTRVIVTMGTKSRWPIETGSRESMDGLGQGEERLVLEKAWMAWGQGEDNQGLPGTSRVSRVAGGASSSARAISHGDLEPENERMRM